MKLIVAVETALLIWFAVALVKVENQLYAWEVGLCMPIVAYTEDNQGRRIEHRAASTLDNYACLEQVQSRMGWDAHLLFALLR